MSLTQIRKALRRAASPDQATESQQFFKTGPGQYGEGDRFIGVRMPPLREIVKSTDALTWTETLQLLHSPWHEERLLALLIWNRRFAQGEVPLRRKIFTQYAAETAWINNWDLVDVSAPNIVGVWLLDKTRGALTRWAKSPQLWERRIAIIATLTLIRAGQFDDTLKISALLLADPHDLIHKAAGWMLREVGKRQPGILEKFLDQHRSHMPRTMLRYAIERMPERQRLRYLRGT